MYSPEDFFVVLGAHNLSSKNENGVVQVNVTEIYVHSEWDPYIESFDADLDVLILGDTVRLFGK